MPRVRYLRSRAPLLASLAGAVLLFTYSGTSGQETDEPTGVTSEGSLASDMIFTAGEDVIASGKTIDDLFAAGSTVDADGARADHLFLAGGEISVSDAEVSDLIAAGGEIRLNRATVKDDVIAAGGDILVGRDFDIAGTAVFSGGKVRVEAPVGGDLRIGASDIFVNSVIAGDARLSGDKVKLGPNARIGGNLHYRSEDLVMDPAAVVTGSESRLPPNEDYAAEDIGAGMGRLFLLFSLSMIISYFVLVVVLVLGFPRLITAASGMIRTRPWQSLGIGVLYFLLVPLLVLLLFTTVLAAPLAVLLIVISIALTPIALAVTAYFLGMGARRFITKESSPPEKLVSKLLWPLLGVVVLFALTLIPFGGLVICLIAMLFGLGAFARQAAGALTTPVEGPATA